MHLATTKEAVGASICFVASSNIAVNMVKSMSAPSLLRSTLCVAQNPFLIYY